MMNIDNYRDRRGPAFAFEQAARTVMVQISSSAKLFSGAVMAVALGAIDAIHFHALGQSFDDGLIISGLGSLGMTELGVNAKTLAAFVQSLIGANKQ